MVMSDMTDKGDQARGNAPPSHPPLAPAPRSRLSAQRLSFLHHTSRTIFAPISLFPVPPSPSSTLRSQAPSWISIRIHRTRNGIAQETSCQFGDFRRPESSVVEFLRGELDPLFHRWVRERDCHRHPNPRSFPLLHFLRYARCLRFCYLAQHSRHGGNRVSGVALWWSFEHHQCKWTNPLLSNRRLSY